MKSASNKQIITTVRKIISQLPDDVFGPSASLVALAIIGSNVNPETRRKSSDLDLVAVIKDNSITSADTFKYTYMSNKVSAAISGEKGNMAIDIKFYTAESFERELLHGTNTALFAFLHAYTVIYDTADLALDIIRSAEERMEATIAFTIDQLRTLDIPYEINNMSVYFTEGYNILTAEKYSSLGALRMITFAEYLKAFCIQFLRLRYAKDIQSGEPQDDRFKDLIRHLVVLSRWDGTRLLNYRKYLFDTRLLQMMQDVDAYFQAGNDLDKKIQFTFQQAGELFRLHFEKNLVRDPNDVFEFTRFMTVGGVQ